MDASSKILLTVFLDKKGFFRYNLCNYSVLVLHVAVNAISAVFNVNYYWVICHERHVIDS